MDFMKQDGVTEIEESIEANMLERYLNDLLLQDEQDGKVFAKVLFIHILQILTPYGCHRHLNNRLKLEDIPL